MIRVEIAILTGWKFDTKRRVAWYISEDLRVDSQSEYDCM